MEKGQAVIKPLMVYSTDNKKEMLEPKKGTVIYIHPEGRYYTAEFEYPAGKLRQCYDVGDV